MEVPRPTPAAVPWAQEFFTFGVTGTNGKTSTVHLLTSAIAATGAHALSVSTVGSLLDGRRLDLPGSARGFVDACAALRDAGGRFAVVECTSKSLAEGYAKRWRFDMGVFTNLSPDHLSTHGSWEHYLASKAQLFTHLGPGRTAVLNAADRHSLLLDRVIPRDVERRWYGSPTRGPLHHPAELVAIAVEVDAGGTFVRLAPSPAAEALGEELHVRMVGEVYAENALAAACAGLAAGLPGEQIAEGLARCSPVPGRFEVLAREPIVVVDYAHSPDALGRTCDTARGLATGRVIVVFGAGGESSPGKRLPMGEAVGARADVAIVTSDNPRGEDPGAIAQMLVEGVTVGGRARTEIELDRRLAIERAVALAGPGDVVVVAGKGHELGQQVGEQLLPFSDRDEVRRLTGVSDA
ncbi:MAG: UDP-N-acetylmuramyl-tripeptide synthetase [Myxococcales bacterium]|nr:UDP-N-acetylmuramyl-tripeptide synthetase [Myxococcales bacterium]